MSDEKECEECGMVLGDNPDCWRCDIHANDPEHLSAKIVELHDDLLRLHGLLRSAKSERGRAVVNLARAERRVANLQPEVVDLRAQVHEQLVELKQLRRMHLDGFTAWQQERALMLRRIRSLEFQVKQTEQQSPPEEGTVECSHCNGMGTWSCDNCGGTGRVHDGPRPFDPDARPAAWRETDRAEWDKKHGVPPYGRPVWQIHATLNKVADQVKETGYTLRTLRDEFTLEHDVLVRVCEALSTLDDAAALLPERDTSWPRSR